MNKNLEVTIDNYFNNVDLGMVMGKIVGHKIWLKSIVDKAILDAKIEEIESWIRDKTDFESVHVLSMKTYLKSLKESQSNENR